ncbi:MAG: PPC domain-containing protein, partial [Planctomycetaceae bacterium]|nr:PPC domain-containing protein [Planctomycetaceae bacterium]
MSTFATRIPLSQIATVTLSFLGLLCSARAQTSYPMLMALTPVAAQTGQASEHSLTSRYSMFGAYRVLVTGDGVTGEVVTPMELDKDGKEPSLTTIKLRFTVAEDALPGVRDFRIVGPTGASTVGQLVVVTSPVVSEDGANNTADAANAITVPSTVCGAVERAEDVDFYRFSLTTPAAMTFHCQAMRLQDKIHDLQTHIDPIITIRNAKNGSTIAAADNTFAADPFLACNLPEGDFLLEVRDVRYQGNTYWNYAIEVDSRPFISNVHPLAVTRGTEASLQLIGSGMNEPVVTSFTAPADAPPAAIDVVLPMPAGKTNPVPVVITDLPVSLEENAENNTFAQAQGIPVPGAIAGRIESESDIDCYSFEATKGDRLNIEVVARRNGSGLDSIIRLLNSEGKSLTENDDLREWNRRTSQDSLIEGWTAPAAGKN